MRLRTHEALGQPGVGAGLSIFGIESGSCERKLLILTVLCLQAGFQFFDGLPGFYGCRTGDRANNASRSGLLVPIHADFGLGFH